VPPRDGEGTPPDNDDELLAKVIPLRRRRGEPAQNVADELGGASDPPEDPPPVGEWSIWEQLPAELRWRERKPVTLHILADEPGHGFERPEPPSAPGEWSIWDPMPAPLPRRPAPDAARSAGAQAGGPPTRGLRRSRRLIAPVAAAAGTAIAAVALASVLGVLHGQSRPTPQRASSGLQASKQIQGSSGLAAQPTSPRHRSTATHPGSRRRTAGEPKAKTTSKAPKLVPSGSGGGVSATVQYRSAASQSPTSASTSPAPAEGTATPNATSASASREFGFEH
jgi:hypothetical protein